jgi:hypothetical protein
MVLALKANGWCMKCVAIARGEKSRTVKVGSVRSLIERRGWTMLNCGSDDEFIGWKGAVSFQCDRGHQNETTADLARRCGCRQCTIDASRLTVADAAAVGAEHGLTMSSGYKDFNSAVLWKCRSGHSFRRSIAGIKKSARCPRCNVIWFSQDTWCQAAEYLLSTTAIVNTKPSWLRMLNNGNVLQLDIYFPNVAHGSGRGIAIEVMGRQHYEVDGWFIKS